MESVDRETIFELKEENVQLNRLYNKHESLEFQLDKYSNKVYLTAIEEQEVKKLKSKKLQGVDEMMKIIKSYKKAA